ncbi:fatty-acid--CoA ligase FadD5 [Gordonia sp. (in: high G+C Gram-positive bacteria)]|jgi:fatty-acyl-CoA synthase|uniref:fatty-acid--CoA ligase FadD5 n=1 Tax=Gordonia sp. (in: high G+C Gram-positive bacteria) TaxID=84139 RepID=UPI001D5E7423|nr:fatty-acid--CoA ligase FadD5 [Gordonia sp. (in: high G+C Gram-positive bacteria)]MCB1295689.1 fatty-acid--CoA ligase FadD5 [Gordonia sp. (in: high G+C Gram-positive bacteria)]HMS75104.1 fatty-acid--CoA ligase FadD5 [Gordonia sp. (in: high G+C Gram-positive bacteria)]HQV17936.1 fatty-acid--CoA ligase FadD5 [Gordonia sp. (in: high G+C Gram-positive bacteria)]
MTSADLSDGADGRVTEPLRSRRNHWNNQVRRHALTIPDAPALKYAGKVTTWSELDARSHAFAAALHRRGVGFGDRVLLLMLNRSEYVEAIFGANILGAIAVPVNIRMAPAEIAFLVSDSGAKVVVTETLLAPLAGAVQAAAPGIEQIIVVGGSDSPAHLDYETLLAEGADDLPEIDVPEESVALIMYTSGTTGKPKGAMLTHQNMQAQAVTCLRELQTRADDIGSMVVPMFHIAAIGAMSALFYMGALSVIHPLGAFDPNELLDALETERTTSIFLVPVQWQAVCAAQQAKPRDLALRIISWGAAPASDTVLKAMDATFPDALNVAVFGQTEMSPITCVLEGKDAQRKLGSVGKVIPAVTARIVDPAMNDVADGEVGEIVYRGPNLMLGYWQNPEGTADSFRGGWFHSGDLVRRDSEGFIYVVDRAKDMIISGGENIYCAEVENALAAHPRILEAAVIGRADPKWGEVPVAVVVTNDGADMTLEELEPHLNDHLARYKHPKDLVLVPELPRNASGKIVKPSLRSSYGSKDAGLAGHAV